MDNKEFYIPNDGIRIHAKLDFPQKNTGSKERYPLVILIHGFTGHMEERHIIAASEAMNEVGYATLRAEMYGHGKTGGHFCDHTLYKWVTCALAVVDYAKTLDFVEGLYLCGHSQGGLLTILVAAMEKDLWKAIIPMSPALSIPECARNGELLGCHFDPEHIPETLQMGNGRTLNGNYIRVARTIDVDRAIEQYDGPVLLIHGSKDETIPISCSYKAAEKYKNATLAVIPEDSHCYDHHLELATQAIQTFLLQMALQVECT